MSNNKDNSQIIGSGMSIDLLVFCLEFTPAVLAVG